ncbi:MAG TPA: type II toxin-antitoxin system VapC family toxin [Rhizomicrobium sp.]|jgi:ribonuclease VapC
MVVDASAVLAVLLEEPEAGMFKHALAEASVLHISPVNWFEIAIKAEKAGKQDVAAFHDFMDRLSVVVVPVDESQMHLAHDAWRDFGKGRHPAKLNLGDCFAYALAKQMGEPLLFKGGDFGRTDIKSAV